MCADACVLNTGHMHLHTCMCLRRPWPTSKNFDKGLDLCAGLRAVHGLLEAGASPSSQDAVGATALTWAIERGRKDVLEILAKYEYAPKNTCCFLHVSACMNKHSWSPSARTPPSENRRSCAHARTRVWLCGADGACLCDAGTVRRRSCSRRAASDP